ncbi:MAG: trimethylamine methyltransferase family protein, partial [Gammaproteobacteria bacterium]|nr:trimethylamine methyltransferase family protein [Gammaproteobacteria bacterium]MDD9874096.1 trimethylamine methyltransferase family protein [Gammaproteobacteria bacterium]
MRQKRARGRRAGGNGRGGAGGVQQRPWKLVRNPYPPLDILSAGQVEAVDRAALGILAERGLVFHSREALEVLDHHGAAVDFDSGVTKFDAAVIRGHIAHAPASFKLHARNPRKNAVIGGNHMVFAPVSGPPNISDLDNGRRPGAYKDQCDLIRLSHMLNALHLGGGSSVEAMDLPADTRHLDFYRAQT